MIPYGATVGSVFPRCHTLTLTQLYYSMNESKLKLLSLGSLRESTEEDLITCLPKLVSFHWFILHLLSASKNR